MFVAAVGLAALFSSHVSARIITPSELAASYDFVIAGGGVGGLVLASRLSEDANKTVLVLEAGDTGDAVKSSIDIPGNAYYSSLLGTSYDWQYNTVAQTSMNNRVIPWSRGKVLGGSSAVNGLYLVRPSKVEIDANAGLMAGEPSSSAWTWDSFFEAMKKSETFTPPSADIQQEAGIQYNLASHGTSGPLHYAYPGFIVPIVGNWTSTLSWIGIPASADPNGGSGVGGFVATSSINPSNWTRSYARSAYIDPLPPRPNLFILPNATVTRILFNNAGSNLTASGVEWAASADAPRATIGVNLEVISSGGAIGSPHLLMHSGIGPKDILDAAGVTVNIDLPGVGQHLQDHLSTQVVFNTTAETAASIKGTSQTSNGQSTSFLSFINSAIAYANSSDLFGIDFPAQFQTEIMNALSDNAQNLVPSNDPTVRAGYKAIYTTTAETFLTHQVGQIELLLSLTGTAVGGANSIAIQAALQHPFSQGRIYITTNNPFDYPLIDPQYLSHSADLPILREGLKLARKLGNTFPLNSSIVAELSPGPSVQTDDDWDNWAKQNAGTEFHPSCSCAMLPLKEGGVVDANLKVYGTSNVRVVDASVFALEFAAHLQSLTYGLGEQAASIIRAQYNGLPPPAALTTATPTSASVPSTTSKSGSTGTGKGSDKGNSAASDLVFSALTAVFGAVGASVMMMF
ncbi:GMC oxidoreductase [Sphaerobolus stellatus SS14]|nr:GMC oxidoreductase [Sphaerobolus stellatus SS14]